MSLRVGVQSESGACISTVGSIYILEGTFQLFNNTLVMVGQNQLLWKIREVPGKSKWKFKMAFAMKGGVETGLECHIPILKNDFC